MEYRIGKVSAGGGGVVMIMAGDGTNDTEGLAGMAGEMWVWWAPLRPSASSGMCA